MPTTRRRTLMIALVAVAALCAGCKAGPVEARPTGSSPTVVAPSPDASTTPSPGSTATTDPAPSASATPSATPAPTATPTTPGPTSTPTAPASAPPVAAPTGLGGIVVDYQLGGAYALPAGVGGVVRDSTSEPAPGAYSICYVNGFQTQPDERSMWLREHPDLVLRDADGRVVADPGWPDELLLDMSTDDKRARLADLVGTTLQRCADAGFDAVELDNLDSYTRSGGLLTADDALATAARYVAVAHGLGLAVGQKNAADLTRRGHDEVGFDFAVAEECHRWDECAAYTDVYGDQVIDVEYADDLRGTFAEVCADPQTPFSTVLRDHDLTTPASRAHVFEACPRG
ncbi:endo alpha-1,4 polygalactosaminidase [Cellulomonas sp. NS3]|uniref:endo alpha-1,4 polygalactosaminidase n=1 Tax=Cellulomonas sp. NS3 TaxID=2973977 RepID=UPI002163C1D3|nr:endo alpha-1,4 polygalactosaminidase [Cellulomonas sp. NS3]